MNDLETVYSCPLGSTCREIKDNKIHQCHWLVKLQGKDPQSEEVYDDWKCAIAWQPILMVENAQQIRGMTQATESFRNESVKSNHDLIKTAVLLSQSSKERDITPKQSLLTEDK